MTAKQLKTNYWLPGLVILFSFIGFIDAAYLTVKHYRGEIVPCSEKFGCEQVLNSPYATVLGIPLALLGMIFYLTIFIFTIVYLDTKREKIIRAVGYLTIIGFSVSLILVYLQWFVIKAWCQYCLLSAATAATLFVLGIILLFRFRRLR